MQKKVGGYGRGWSGMGFVGGGGWLVVRLGEGVVVGNGGVNPEEKVLYNVHKGIV